MDEEYFLQGPTGSAVAWRVDLGFAAVQGTKKSQNLDRKRSSATVHKRLGTLSLASIADRVVCWGLSGSL